MTLYETLLYIFLKITSLVIILPDLIEINSTKINNKSIINFIIILYNLIDSNLIKNDFQKINDKYYYKN